MTYNYKLKLRIQIDETNDLLSCLTYLKSQHANLTYLKLYGGWDSGAVECHFDSTNEIIIKDKKTALKAEFFGLMSDVQVIESEVQEVE